MFGAKDKAAFHQVWNHNDALCIPHNFFWNAFVGRADNGVEHIRRQAQALNGILAPGGSPKSSGRQCESAN
jgi:hypothetical protein